jgi:hypothetical protein
MIKRALLAAACLLAGYAVGRHVRWQHEFDVQD